MSKRILIVEDNEDTLELLCAQLEEPGYELTTARNGQEAILSVGEQPPDVVIMDIMMPELDGLETSRYFKMRYRERFLPILVLSAKSDVASREEAATFGCEDFIGKPHSRKQLLASVVLLVELSEHENALQGTEGAGKPDANAGERVAEIRTQLAGRQVNEQSIGIAKGHLRRALELAPGATQAKQLLGQIDG